MVAISKLNFHLDMWDCVCVWQVGLVNMHYYASTLKHPMCILNCPPCKTAWIAPNYPDVLKLSKQLYVHITAPLPSVWASPHKTTSDDVFQCGSILMHCFSSFPTLIPPWGIPVLFLCANWLNYRQCNVEWWDASKSLSCSFCLAWFLCPYY